MRFIGNIIWFIFGGFIGFMIWMVVGILWCCTIIGIPAGVQSFKMAWLTLWPFGKEVVNNGSFTSVLFNVIWILLSGVELAVYHLCFGALFCITIVGIPFGIQHFKLAQLALLPFGTEIK